MISFGTLYGFDSDGEEFEAVRDIDVYEVRDGYIRSVDTDNALVADGVVEL